jgi:hypothetical protein
VVKLALIGLAWTGLALHDPDLQPLWKDIERAGGRWARDEGIKLVAVPTEQACQLLGSLKRKEAFAVLHVTC